jgi:hypothetical protein
MLIYQWPYKLWFLTKGYALKYTHIMDKKFLHTKLFPLKKLEFCSPTKTPTRITLHFPKYKVLVWEVFLLYYFNFGFSPKKFPLNAFRRFYNHYPSHDGQSAPQLTAICIPLYHLCMTHCPSVFSSICAIHLLLTEAYQRDVAARSQLLSTVLMILLHHMILMCCELMGTKDLS